jgi:hypothetical protein
MVNYCLEIVVEKLTSKNYCQKITGGRSVEEDGGILSNQIAGGKWSILFLNVTVGEPRRPSTEYR